MTWFTNWGTTPADLGEYDQSARAHGRSGAAQPTAPGGSPGGGGASAERSGRPAGVVPLGAPGDREPPANGGLVLHHHGPAPGSDGALGRRLGSVGARQSG
jgi:hypothetical protein